LPIPQFARFAHSVVRQYRMHSVFPSSSSSKQMPSVQKKGKPKKTIDNALTRTSLRVQRLGVSNIFSTRDRYCFNRVVCPQRARFAVCPPTLPHRRAPPLLRSPNIALRRAGVHRRDLSTSLVAAMACKAHYHPSANMRRSLAVALAVPLKPKFAGYGSLPPSRPWLSAMSCFKCFRHFRLMF
jgi:hypothetical protein